MTLRNSIFDRLDNSSVRRSNRLPVAKLPATRRMTDAELFGEPPRPSIARLADCAPVASPDSWPERQSPRINSVVPCHRGTNCGWPACPSDCDGRPGNSGDNAPRPRYIDNTPVMRAAHAAVEAEGRATGYAVIKMAARMYALRPTDLDAICLGLSGLTSSRLVTMIAAINNLQRPYIGFGGEVPAINLRGAMLYARLLRAKARQIARRAAA